MNPIRCLNEVLTVVEKRRFRIIHEKRVENKKKT